MQLPVQNSFSELLEQRGYTIVNKEELASKQIDIDPKVPILKNLINLIAKEENPELLPEKYTATKQWIYSCTEEIKKELIRILYAFYYHSILIMLKAGVNKQIITTFTKENMNDHHSYHIQDRPKLYQLIYNFNRLPEPQKYDSTFGVKITQTSMNALMAFLEQNNFAIFIKIIEEKLVVEYVSYDKVQYAPDLITDFIIPIDASTDTTKKLTLSLVKDNITDLTNQFIQKLASRQAEQRQDPSMRVTDDYQLTIHDDSAKRGSSVIKLPDVYFNQIIATAVNYKNMARLTKSELPSTAYFTFPEHDAAYDVNDDGTLLSVCTTKGITKLISPDPRTDLYDLPVFSQVTASRDPYHAFSFQNEVESYPNTYNTRTLIGPRSFFTRFSPSSQFLMTGGSEYVRIWKCEHIGAFSHVTTPGCVNWCCDWSPYNHQFVTGCSDYNAYLWSVTRSKMIRVFSAHQKPISDCKFHPNSQIIATCSPDSSIHLWDIKDGTSTRTFADRIEPPACMQFTRNGTILITGDEAGALTAWDLRADNKLGRCQAHKGAVRDITMSVEGTLMATVGSDREIMLWDIDMFKTSAISQAKPLKKLQPSMSDTRRAKFSSRNLLIALGSKIEK